jgi:hypothetical protein
MSDDEIIRNINNIKSLEESDLIRNKIIEDAIENLKKIVTSEISDVTNNLLIRLLDYDDAIGKYIVTEEDETSPYYHSQDAQLYMSAVKNGEFIYNVDCSKIRMAAKKELIRRGINLDEINKIEINNNPLRMALLGTWIYDEMVKKEIKNINYLPLTNSTRKEYTPEGFLIPSSLRSMTTHSPSSKFITSTNRNMKKYTPNGKVIYKINEELVGKFKFTLTKKGILREIGKNNDDQTISNFYKISITGSIMKMDRLTYSGRESIWNKVP